MKLTILSFLVLLLLAEATAFAAPVLVSRPLAGSASAGGNSFDPVFSADGQHIVFVSHANNLVTNDDLRLWLDIFVRDLPTGNTVLVSVSTNGIGGANWNANAPSLSSNGQFIAFASRAGNVVPGDTNDAADIFVRDVNAGTTRLVSVDVPGNVRFDSGNPVISANGRWVFFERSATNVIFPPSDPAGANIFARDTLSNVTLLVTADTNGNPLSGRCELAGITPSGRFAAFTTTNSGLVPGVANAGPDVYVRDMENGELIHASSGVPGAGSLPEGFKCSYPVLAENGSAVIFNATSNLNGTTLLVSFDLQSRSTTVIASGVSNSPPAISADGSVVAFEALGYSVSRIYLWYRTNNSTVLVYESQPNYPQYPGHLRGLSRDGRYVTFADGSFGLAPNALLGVYQLYRKDMVSGTTALLSSTTNGTVSATTHELSSMALSPDATRVAFHSVADDLVPGDLNGMSDSFLRDANANTTELITTALPSKLAATAFAHSLLGPNSVSADGRFVAFRRYDDPSAFRDTNGLIDVYVSDVLLSNTHGLSIDTNLYEPPDGAAGPPFYRENTNGYSVAVISADGSTIAAQGQSSLLGRSSIYWARASSNVFGSGMFLASRGVNVSENGSSYLPSISSNGLLLVFTSTSSDLVEGVPDNNSLPDIYLRRMSVLSNGLLTATNELVSVSTSGTSGNNASTNGFISPDGRWVIFESQASNLATNSNPGGSFALFARDLWSHTTHLASVGPTGGNQWGCVPVAQPSAAIHATSHFRAGTFISPFTICSRAPVLWRKIQAQSVRR